MVRLPVLQRELGVLARKRRFFVERFTWAAVAFGATLLFVLPSGGGGGGGRGVFLTLSWTMAALGAFEVTVAVSDAIGKESRQGTLELLWLASVGRAQILAGKLLAHTLPPMVCILGAIPSLAICFMAGGVTGQMFLWTVISLVQILVFSAALGLACSSWSRESGKATWTALLAMGLISITPLVLVLHPATSSAADAWGWHTLSPFSSLLMTGRSTAGSSVVAEAFWQSVAMALTASVGLLMIALWGLHQRPARLEPSTQTTATRRRREVSRHELERPGPARWLIDRGPYPGQFRSIIRGAVLVGLAVALGSFVSSTWTIAIVAGNVAGHLVKLAFTWQAASLFSNLRENGLTETLATVPPGWRAWKLALLREGRSRIQPAFLAIVACSLFSVFAAWPLNLTSAGTVWLTFPLLPLVTGWATAWFDLWAVHWYAAATSLHTTTATRAFTKAYLMVYVAPFVPTIPLLAVLGGLLQWGNLQWFLLLLRPALFILYAIAVVGYAKNKALATSEESDFANLMAREA